MKKINKKLSLCIALALMQSAFVSNSFAAAPTVTNQGSGYYFGIGTEPTLADLAKKGIIDYKKANQKPQNNNENGEGAGPNALDKNNYGALTAGMGAFASHGFSTAVGYNATSVISSTSLGAASYATSNSAAVGVNAYATNKGTSVGNNTQSDNGVAIGYNATAGDFYKYLPGERFTSYSGTELSATMLLPEEAFLLVPTLGQRLMVLPWATGRM